MNETAPRFDEPELRRATAADAEGLRRLNEAAFGYTGADDLPGPWLEAYARPLSQVATIGGEIVGAAAAFEMELTLPGGASLTCPGVTSVSVMPTHRRRGVLKQMMAAQLGDIRRSGAAIAALTASEATIYERFGYGVATQFAKYVVDTTRARFRTEPGPGSMTMITTAEARDLLPSIHDAKRVARHGMTHRPDELWKHFFADPEAERDDASGLFHAVHLSATGQPDGYVSYRVVENDGVDGSANEIRMEHLVGHGPTVEVDLWRFLCSLDLAVQVSGLAPVRDPLRSVVVDPRAVRTVAVRDHLWIRIIDLATVLSARRYERDGELVIGCVDWEFTNNTGQFRLTIDGGVATVQRTEDAPVAMADISSWGTLMLGGGDATHLALSGRLQGDPNVVNSCFRTSHEPWNDADF